MNSNKKILLYVDIECTQDCQIDATEFIDVLTEWGEDCKEHIEGIVDIKCEM